MATAEHKATAREKFGPLGDALADLRLHAVDVRSDVVPAVYRIDPRSVPLADMVAVATDVSRAIAAAQPSVRYNWVPVLTQLTRELFASTEGALIDQAFALTQGAASVVAVGAGTSQEIYDVMGHQRGWEIIGEGVDEPLLGFPPFRDFALALARDAAELAAAPALPTSEREVVVVRSEEHTSELQSLAYLVCRLLLEKKKKRITTRARIYINDIWDQMSS